MIYLLFRGSLYEGFDEGFSIAIIIRLLSGFIFFMIASFAYLNLSLVVELISLWADNIWSLMVMVRFICFFMGGAYVPISFFPESLQVILKYTPFPYLMNLPIKIIMGKTNSDEVILGLLSLLAWSAFFRVISYLIWKKGQYKYSGVGI